MTTKQPPESMSTQQLVLRPIGTIHTHFTRAEGTPIQSSMARGVRGTVEVFPEYAEGLRDLAGFERIWLLYWFDQAGPARLSVKPFLQDSEHGVFATRAPCRPNPLGISCVALIRIRGNVLEISDVDILDKTPLVDIKPYCPRFDLFRVTRSGWVDDARPGDLLADERFSRPTSGEE